MSIQGLDEAKVTEPGVVTISPPEKASTKFADIVSPAQTSSSAQFGSGPHVSSGDLQPGDLVFYYSPISHVGIYIGGGRVIDAPYPGLSVHISGLYSMPLVGAGRP